MANEKEKMAGIGSDKSGAAFIPVRVIISIALGAAIIGLVFLGLQNADEVTGQEEVRRACNSLEAHLSTIIKGDARDVDDPSDSLGSTYHWDPTLPDELSYLGLGVDPDPDNDGRLQGGITDVGNCIYYKTEGGAKQVIWLDGNIKLRGGRKLNGRWTLEEPDGYILQNGGTINLTFEAVEKHSQRYILIRADDGLYTDRIPPEVNITSPSAECYLDGPLTVNWTADDDYADISKVDIAYRAVEDSSWTSIASGVENNGTYQITNPFPDSGRYRVRVSAHDGRNTGSDVSEPISYQFPYTTLNAEPCYRGEDAWWITPSSDLSFLTHYAANTYHRIWDEEIGWDSWKTGNPILSSRGKYYIEFYSTGNGLNESSPNWEYVNNQTIYVDDTTPVSYAEIEGPATTATKPINIVFLVATHADMSHEWDYLCDNYYDELISKFVKRKIDCNYVIYGIQNNLYCSGSYWDAGHCSNWGPAVIDVAESYTWEDNAVRVIIPISDEGPYEGGTGHGDKDYEVIEDAINVCNENDVVVYPLEGYKKALRANARMNCPQCSSSR